MRSLLRAIDANANRAREALRTLEDVARFSLDHAELCTAQKRLRHDLAGALDALPTNPIIARDTRMDVGIDIATPSEGRRNGVRDIAVAASKRLTEALRSIEEHAKAIEAPRAAQMFEQLRYRAYDIEQQLTLALGSANRTQWGVCVIVTERHCTHPWSQVARAALEGGAACIQLREKDRPDRELLQRAHTLRAITREHDAALIINDRPDIALLCDADGVHLGQEDLPIVDVRRIVGLERLIGASATTIEQARAAARAGADYLGLGPMFPTTTKSAPGGRTDGSCAGPALLRAYLAADGPHLPHLAIGGIAPEALPALVEVDCRGVATCAAVCAANEPASIVRALVAALHNPQTVTVAHS